ncbi:unnamed protein product, partial [Symbiodinium sp. CCMP2592]
LKMLEKFPSKLAKHNAKRKKVDPNGHCYQAVFVEALTCRLQTSTWRASQQVATSGYRHDVKAYWYNCCHQLLQHIVFMHYLSNFDPVFQDGKAESECLFWQMVLDCDMIDCIPKQNGECRDEALHRVHRDLVGLLAQFLTNLRMRSLKSSCDEDSEWWFQQFVLLRYQSYCAQTMQELMEVEEKLQRELPSTFDPAEKQRVTFTKLFARIYFFAMAPASLPCKSCLSHAPNQGCEDCARLGAAAEELRQVLADSSKRLEKVKQASKALRDFAWEVNDLERQAGCSWFQLHIRLLHQACKRHLQRALQPADVTALQPAMDVIEKDMKSAADLLDVPEFAGQPNPPVVVLHL